MAIMILYHYSPESNRQGILSSGLLTARDQTGYSSVFLTDRFDPNFSDCWKVDCSTLSIEKDETTDQDEGEHGKWYMTFQDVPPHLIERLNKI